MQYVCQTIEQLRRYIHSSDERMDLEEVDTLLSIALDEARRRLAAKKKKIQLLDADHAFKN